jgi:hypothetical protein
MAKPLCKTCGTPLEPITNKNKGYYVGCPNKANHGTEVKQPLLPAPIAKEPAKPAPAPAKTLFGW